MINSCTKPLAASFLAMVLSLPVSAGDEGDQVQQLLSVANEACFVRGGDISALKLQAESEGWKAAPPQELAKHTTAFTEMVGGWTFTNGGVATAVLQSAFLPPHSGTVCSITTKLSSDADHLRVKSGFAELFGVTIAEEADSPAEHVDSYWIDRGQQPPVRTTIIFEKARRALTLRLIHGSGVPTQS